MEFKYALTGPGQLEELLQELEKAFGPWEAVEVGRFYYDTPDQALAARHFGPCSCARKAGALT